MSWVQKERKTAWNIPDCPTNKKNESISSSKYEYPKKKKKKGFATMDR